MQHLAVAARAHQFGTDESVCIRGLTTHGGSPQLVVLPTMHSPQISSATGQGTNFSFLGAIGPSRDQHVSNHHRLAIFSENAVNAGGEDRYVGMAT